MRSARALGSPKTTLPTLTDRLIADETGELELLRGLEGVIEFLRSREVKRGRGVQQVQ